MDTVIMGNQRLYDIMKEKDALYAKPDFNEADGEKAAELEGEFAEMDGWNAESDAATLLTGLGIPAEEHTMLMSELQAGDYMETHTALPMRISQKGLPSLIHLSTSISTRP